MKNYVIGVDVGGTNIKIGLLHQSEGIVARNRLETKAYGRDRNRLMRAVVDAIGDLLKARGISRLQVAGAGMGLPGPVDTNSGVVKYLPNIPGWKNVPLARQLRKQLRLPVFIDNDVNLITLGEWKYGAGRGYANLFCVTLGTGVGSGLVINGNLYRGEGFVAGEIGHAVMRDDFHSRRFADGYAYVEHYAGNGALLEKARQMISPKLTSLEDIYPLVRKKNRKALKFYDHTGRFLGNVLVGVINLLNPRLVIIGGGVSNHYPYFQKSLKAAVNEKAMTVHRRMVKITRARLGDDAGLYGADILVRQCLREERL
jgi:glucokinase